ncbi:WxL domain-containing protein [Candidatus Enterococcus ikei]|uniref:WxL domain-containing protein n=1 Tax=Candidatus Enterococcus ikei TaxID=2815326 RepID=A0ABS3H2P3_9ENTE|nr:WxL domain-containing protein [Enterococcus sp. DIV0869a]MBO0441796.1 WxL domain-containing protein [Enterococcus sp. DIV0869a]
MKKFFRILSVFLVGIATIGYFHLNNTSIKAEDEPEQQTQIHRSTGTSRATLEGETRKVSTGEEMRDAVNNDKVSQIEMLNNITMGFTVKPKEIRRDLVIRGNGFTLQMTGHTWEVRYGKHTFRLENMRVGYSLEGAMFEYAAYPSSLAKSYMEMENVSEAANNKGSITNLGSSHVVFTGGKNEFKSTRAKPYLFAQTSMTLKGGAEVYIEQPDITIIKKVTDTYAMPYDLNITENSKMIINTKQSDTPKSPLTGLRYIDVNTQSSLEVNALASDASTSVPVVDFDTNPTYSSGLYVTGAGEISISGTGSRMGINLPGEVYGTAVSATNKSKLNVKTKLGSNVVVGNGKDTTIKATGGSQIDFEGAGEKVIDVTAVSPQINVSQNSRINVQHNTKTAGSSINMYGKGTLSTHKTAINVTSSSELNMQRNGGDAGSNVYLEGTLPTVNVTTGSKTTLKNSGISSLWMKGSNTQFTVSESEFNQESTSQTWSMAAGGIHMVGNAPNMMIEKNSSVKLNGLTSPTIQLDGTGAKLSVTGGSKMNSKVGDTDSIRLLGNQPQLTVSGVGTLFVSESNRQRFVDGAGTIYLGNPDVDSLSKDATITVEDQAVVNLISNLSSAMVMQSSYGVFNLSSGAKINLKSGPTDGYVNNANATLRFMRSGYESRQNGHYLFNIDNAEMNIEKSGGSAAGVRLFGHGNQVNVKNNGKFTINNPGNGTPNDGGDAVGNQGVHYIKASDITGDRNEFNVTGQGSEVRIAANSGPAIDMHDQPGLITASNGGYFEARGKTATTNTGIFRTSDRLDVVFDKPLFMDFTNTRGNGGNIFTVNSSSTLTATKSDLSLWKKGTGVEQDPDLNFIDLNYAFKGSNFDTLGTTNRPGDFNTNTIGTQGLTNYTRLSSNNARWAVADVLRVPTTADKKIHGRLSVPVGLNRTRPAWDNEVEATVEVQRASGEKEIYEKVKSVGDSKAKPGISIYGEKPQGGLFEIDTGKYFEVGDKVTITKVNLTSGELTPGFDNQILTKTVEPFQIIPPKPVTVESNAINNQATSIKGHVEDRTVEITATLNGQPLDTSSVVVDEMGNFELSLEAMTLKKGDEIQLFARDHEGSALKAGIVNPPITNNDTGNSNPSQKLTFHDTLFEAAPTINVSELMPLSVLFQDENGRAVHKTLTMFKEPNESVDLTKEEQITSAIQTLKKQEYNLLKKPKPEVIIMNEGKAVVYQFMGPTEELISDKEPQTDEFTIRAVSDFKFPNAPIGTTRASKLDKVTLEPWEGTKGYSSGIEVADMSGTAKGWNVKVAMTTPLQTTEGKELKGWELYIPTEKVKSGGVETKDAIGHSVTVTKEGATGSVFSAAQGKGKGRFINIFESFTEEATTEEGLTRKKGVQLTVPSGAYKGAYQGKLTWTLQNVPN